MVPAWIPGYLFWIYFAGTALIGSGIAIILKIKTALSAALLGTMIFIWFIILHIPRVITASSTEIADEVTSAFLALAYSGIAFAIAGAAKKKKLVSDQTRGESQNFLGLSRTADLSQREANYCNKAGE